MNLSVHKGTVVDLFLFFLSTSATVLMSFFVFMVLSNSQHS